MAKEYLVYKPGNPQERAEVERRRAIRRGQADLVCEVAQAYGLDLGKLLKVTSL